MLISRFWNLVLRIWNFHYNGPMSTRHIATSTLWQIASQVVMATLSIVTLKMVVTGLSTELYGNYNSAYGYLQIFGILADFGLYAVAVREVSRAENKADVLGAIFILRLLILLCSLGLALLIVWLVPAWRGTPLPIGVTIAAFVPFFTLLSGMLRTIFQISFKMQYVFIAEVTQRIITLALIGIVLFMGARHSNNILYYYWFLAVGGIGSFFLFLFSILFGRRIMSIHPRIDVPLLKRFLKLAAPYGLAFLCTALYRQTDITIIAALRPDYELQNAYYGAVQRMADMAYVIPTFLLNSVLPVLSERDGRGEDTRRLLGKTFFIILILGSISMLFSLFWSRQLVEMLTNASLLSTAARPGADTALQLIALPMFLNGIVMFCFYVLLNRHEWRHLVFTLALGVIISLISNFSLIPQLGFVGAGFTSIMVHVFLACMLLVQTFRIMPIHFSKTHILQWVAFSSLFALFLWLASPLIHSALTTALGILMGGAVAGLLILTLGIHRSMAGE
ncbi:MAG: flippase Wzx [Candidatus Peribacteria bacterium]|nr:flippase Wzx [Candidatus Peribacteria bacterium]